MSITNTSESVGPSASDSSQCEMYSIVESASGDFTDSYCVFIIWLFISLISLIILIIMQYRTFYTKWNYNYYTCLCFSSSGNVVNARNCLMIHNWFKFRFKRVFCVAGLLLFLINIFIYFYFSYFVLFSDKQKQHYLLSHRSSENRQICQFDQSNCLQCDFRNPRFCHFQIFS